MEDELRNGNAVHLEVQNTNWEGWGITCVVDRGRGYEERHADLKEGRVRKRRRCTKDSRRLSFKSISGSTTTAQVIHNVEWWAKSPSACTQCARTPPYYLISYAEVPKSSWLQRPWATFNWEKVQSECREIRTLTIGVGRVNWTDRNSLEIPSWERQRDVRRQGIRWYDIKSRTQAEMTQAK